MANKRKKINRRKRRPFVGRNDIGMTKAGPVKIIKADGTVEYQKAHRASPKDQPYSSPRARNFG